MADAGRWHVGCNILNLILRTILLVLNLQVSILIYICKIYGLWRTCACAEYEGNHVALALDLVSLIEPLLSLNFLALGNLVARPFTRSGQVLVRTVAPCPEVETAGPAHLVGIGINGNIVWLEGCRLFYLVSTGQHAAHNAIYQQAHFQGCLAERNLQFFAAFCLLAAGCRFGAVGGVNQLRIILVAYCYELCLHHAFVITRSQINPCHVCLLRHEVAVVVAV